MADPAAVVKYYKETAEYFRKEGDDKSAEYYMSCADFYDGKSSGVVESGEKKADTNGLKNGEKKVGKPLAMLSEYDSE